MPLTLILPILVLTILGALLAKTGWLRPGWQTGLTELTAKLLLPALLLGGTYRTGIPAATSWQLLAAYYLPLIVLFLAIAFAGRGDGAGRALTATYSNNAFVGIPVVVNAFGEAGLTYAFPVIAFHSLVGFTLYYLLSPSSSSGGARVVRSLTGALKNPIVVSLFLGLGLNLAGVVLPQAVARPLDMLASAALPCALMTLGASLVSLRLARPAEAVVATAIKLIALPLAVLALGALVFRLPAQACAVLVVLSACPVGINAAFVIGADGKDTDPASSAILLSSLACAATIPGWLWLLDHI